MRRTGTRRAGRWLIAVSVALALAGCTSGSDSETSRPASRARAVGADPRFAKPGPFAVGVTTLALADREVEVYSPAKPGSTDGRPAATYTQTDPIPPTVLAGLPKVPAGVDLTVKIPAVRDVPIARSGPYPLVVFSHGAGGWRGVAAFPAGVGE